MIGQPQAVATVREAVTAARAAADDQPIGGIGGSAMTHAWLFTGPPGSGRSVAARVFAAALCCTDESEIGCGRCRGCTTGYGGTHADVRLITPEGLSISVKQMRTVVADASRRPSVGKWQVVIIEDADRLTEQAANALLKAVEEPADRTVIMLCAPSTDPEDISVTLRSRCRHVAVQPPGTAAIAAVLQVSGVPAEKALWAASISGGHVGRARRLATDDGAVARRSRALSLARVAVTNNGRGSAAAVEALWKDSDDAAKASNAARNAREIEELTVALGGGGTGKGAGTAARGNAGQIKELERQQKSRMTRSARDLLDLALVDLAGLYRDAVIHGVAGSLGSAPGAPAPLHPDEAEQVAGLARFARPEALLGAIEAVLRCREAIELNVKPVVALDAMMGDIALAMRAGRR